MHTLFLLRHAQTANIVSGGGTDADRPLTALGKRQAELVGERLKLRGVDRALCSSALRARQTFEGTGLDCPVEVMPILYHGGTTIMRQRISEIEEEVGTLLVVGHAPTVPALASQLSEGADPQTVDEVGRWYPPATLTEIAVEGTWESLADEDAIGLLRGIQRP
jgi:phosphohistidine phosphatase